MIRLRYFLCMLMVLLLAACSVALTPIVDAPTLAAQSETIEVAPQSDVDAFFEDAFLTLALRDPEWVSDLALPKVLGFEFRHNTLTNISDVYQRETNEIERDALEQVRNLDRSQLTPDQALSADILEWYLDDRVRGQEFMYHDYRINFIDGVQVWFIDFMADIHPVTNLQEAEDYIVRLERVEKKFDQLLEGLQIREEMGIIPPRWAVETIAGMTAGVASEPVQSSRLYVSFRAKVDALSDVDAATKQSLTNRAAAAIEDYVRPAYRKLAEYLRGLVSKAGTSDGVWMLPDGDAYYAYIVRHHTTTDMTPEEIHNLGLQEVERIQNEMWTLLEELGYSRDAMSLSEALRVAAEDDGYLAAITTADRQALIDAYVSVIEDAKANYVPKLFDIQPSVDYEVRSAPGGGGAYYFPPPLDGSRPGYFYVGTGFERPHYRVPTLAFHEGIPGHHFQLGIQSELDNIPTFRKAIIYNAYAEGWGLYAERLMAEAGYYENDPYGNLGRLQSELFRAVRLVVDTGIHYKRWSFDQAADYMFANLGDFASTDEVARYVTWPGQALSYQIGQLKIVELRERAKEALGDKFDLKEFHHVVLANGAMPLSILEQVVDDWIAEKMES